MRTPHVCQKTKRNGAGFGVNFYSFSFRERSDSVNIAFFRGENGMRLVSMEIPLFIYRDGNLKKKKKHK